MRATRRNPVIPAKRESMGSGAALWIPAFAGMTSAPNGDTQDGKERIRVLSRLLLAAQGLGFELPDVGERHVRQARRHLTEIPDWNCCGASIGYAEGGELPRLALSARNFALAETHMPGKEMVATCAACWLAQREVKERLDHSESSSRKPTRRWPPPACNTRARRRSATWSRC
jgi:hypothetical protein